MKRSQSKDAPSGGLPKRNYLSWNRAVQPKCLRVELADGTFFALPYQHLVCVGFEQGTDDTINVTIARHEVKITGKNLHELALAFQRFTVIGCENCRRAIPKQKWKAFASPASRWMRPEGPSNRFSPTVAHA